jgi:SAM-dependent methyltransferase
MIKDYFYQVRRRCWKMIDALYPEDKDKYAIVKGLVLGALKNGAVILDAGCGHKTELPENTFDHLVVIGLDTVFEDVRRNESVHWRICSTLDGLPLKDESLDVVMSNMVFEHLKDPQRTFGELSRVLRKGGCLIFMTPCIYNIVTLINRIIPNRFHQGLGSLLTGIDEADIFPTYYRANSIRKLRRLLGENRLCEKRFIMYQPPPYAFVFSTLVCRLVIFYFHLINRYDRLKSLRGVIVGQFEKV